ncbi:hypothetical protein Tco_0219411, partial [Tanacetum coccineum]
CMRTRNSYFPNSSNVTIPRRQNKGRAPNIVEPELRTIIAPMAERTMEELLRVPTEGYGEAIVLPEINADHFEIKMNLLHGNQGFQAQNNHALNFQNQRFQNQLFQVPNNQIQQEISNDFSSYKRNNDQMLRNMQNQINSLKRDLKNEIQNTIKSQQAVMMNQPTTFQNNLQNMICGLFQNQVISA